MACPSYVTLLVDYPIKVVKAIIIIIITIIVKHFMPLLCHFLAF